MNERDRPMDQNVTSGTLIDDTAVHPAYNEVVMVSQKTLQVCASIQQIQIFKNPAD